MSDVDKAIRAAKLTLGGILEKNRAKQAKERAPGQIAPSKYMPNVPRAVHADGGGVDSRASNLAAWHADADDAVKNPDGTPKVFYHRTSGDFSTFKADNDGPSGPAMFFGDDPSNLPQMHNRKKVGDNIMPVHLHMKSPLFLDEFNLREMRERHAGGSKDFPHLITPQVADSLQAKGFDGIVAENIYGKAEDANEYVTFRPHQIKSAIGNQGAFDPGNPDITKAEGGEISGDDVAPVADLGQARQQKQIRQFHTGLMGDIKASSNNLMEAHQKALDAGVFDGYEVGDVLQGSAHPMRITGRFVRKWKPSSMTLQSFDRMGAKPTIIDHEDTQYIPMLRYETGLEGTEGWQSGDVYLDGVKAAGYKKMGGLRAVRAAGGRIITDHGLYSKAAEIIRSLPQEKGTVDQYIAAAKARGVKPSEIEHAGRPDGDKISREDMAKHFDRNLPQMEVHQYGENPSYLSKEQEKRIYALWGKPKSEEEQAEYDLLTRRTKGPKVKYESSDYDEDNEPSPTQYHDYTIPGGSNYRERLLTLPKEYGADGYQSSHWDDANVLAHVRMSDRTIGGDRESMRPVGEKLAQRFGVSIRGLSSGSAITGVKEGLITPEEGATFSRFMRWNNGLQDKPGLDKRVLHVEEMQSDWGQEGKKQGFYDPKNPYEIFNTVTGEAVSAHPSRDEARDAYRNIPEDQKASLDYGHARQFVSKKPAAPYVQNTQHWTDLALKNVLHEAAMGNYDHVVFSPGQAQADRYGLETKVDSIAYHPGEKTFTAFKNNRPTVTKNDIDPNGVKNLIGKDLAEKLLHPDNAVDLGGGEMFHSLSGDDLKMGGEGMRGYYDNILPKSVMRLAQQHDPDIKPGSMPLPDQYTGFSIPMTDKLKQGVLGGQTAFKRGGTVEKSIGGSTDGQQDTAGTSQARPEAGGLPVAGGVRGSSGVLPSQGETPLEGLPQNVRIPLTGGSLQAGPDPRIREIARQYMASSGLPYNPPTKYAKVDPGRSKRIAAAYEAMPHNPDDPLSKASYNALAKETMAQYQAAKAAGFKAEFWHPSKQEDPYKASPRLALEDARNNHHMWVYPTYAGFGSGEITDEDVKKNPMLQGTGEHWNGIPVTVNDVFRAIHDYYGHAKEGVGFRADGEENAWRAHASMFSPLARMAMTSETRGQNSWVNYGPHGEANRGARTENTVFAPQKVGIMPDWVHHEGAEDFVTPEDVAEMKRVRAKHSFDFEKALGITRGFTKDGKAATMRLKLKE
jgi:hypothetical protein